MAHGLFVDGVWQSQWYDTTKTGGRFVPTEPLYRNWVTPDGSPGPSGQGGFPAERGAITSTSRSRVPMRTAR